MTLKAAIGLAAALTLGAAAAVRAEKPGAAPGHASKHGHLVCPVMKAPIPHPQKAAHITVNHAPVRVCCPGCIEQIRKDPARYLKQVRDPVTGKPFAVTAASPKTEHRGALFLFSSHHTHREFQAHPDRYRHAPHGGPHGDPHHGHPKDHQKGHQKR